MKKIEIHNGLNDKILRDYFSRELLTVNKPGMKTDEIDRRKKEIYENKPVNIDMSISRIELDIEIFQAELKDLKKVKAILILLDERKWKSWDISNCTEKENGNGWLNFIGTEEEYKDFFNKEQNSNEK